MSAEFCEGVGEESGFVHVVAGEHKGAREFNGVLEVGLSILWGGSIDDSLRKANQGKTCK